MLLWDVTISIRLPAVHIPYIQGYALNPVFINTLSIQLYLQQNMPTCYIECHM